MDPRTGTNPTDASASADAPATTLVTASEGTGTTQQTTQTTQTPPATATETAATTTQTSAEAVAAVVPGSYTFTAPEGTEYDPGVLEAFSGAAKEAGLTQDAAQKLLGTLAPALAVRQADQVKAIHTEWLNASTTDKEFGGVTLAENLGVARKALDNFGTPELRKLLDDTGLGSHPEVIRFMFRAGKAVSEEKYVGGRAPSAATANKANVLYDKTPQR